MRKILFILISFLFFVSCAYADTVAQQFPTVDTWTQEELPDTDYSADTKLSSLGAVGGHRDMVLKFNITNLGATIQDANLTMQLYEQYGGGITTIPYYASNQTWIGSYIDYGTRNSLGQNYAINGSSYTSSGIAVVTWNITAILQHAKNQGDTNVTIFINATGGSGGAYDYYYSVDNSASKPYINVTHTTAVSVNTITIYYPANTTYFHNNNTNFTFSYLSSLYSTLSINATLDGVVIYHNPTYTNNTNVSFLYNVTGLGLHNLTVVTNQTITSRFFTIDDYEAVELNYTQPAYETRTYQYYILYRYNNDSVSNITTGFWYDGTFNGSYNSHSRNATHINITKVFTVPLELTTNNSARTHIWNASITYLNSTNTFVNSTANQNILFAYFFGANAQFQNNTLLSENETFYNRFNLINFSGSALFNATSFYRGNNFTMSALNYTQFNADIIAGMLQNSSALNESYNVSSNITITFGARTRTISTENDTIMIFALILTNCGVGTPSQTHTLNLTLLDEETQGSVRGDIEANFTIHTQGLSNYRGYAFTFTNVSVANICIYPVTTTVLTDGVLRYFNSTSSTRFYYIQNASLTNQSTNIDLYLLHSALSSPVIFFLRDQDNSPYTNSIIDIQRYYVGNGSFKTVAKCKSDVPDGKCATFLRTLDTLYKFTVYNNSNTQVLVDTIPATVVCKPFETFQNCLTQGYPIPIGIGQRDNSFFFTSLTKVSYSCTTNSTSNTIRCTIADSSGLMTASNLLVRQSGALTDTTICNLNSSSSTSTLVCSVSNLTGNYFSYVLSASFAGRTGFYVLTSDTVGTVGSLIDFGAVGLIIALIIITVLFFAGNWDPRAGIILAIVGIVGGYFIGYVPVTISSLIGFVVVLALGAYKIGR